MAEAGSRRQADLMPVGDPAEAVRRGHRNSSCRESRTVMYENNPDDRFEAALRLAEDDPIRGAGALRAIVADDAFDHDTRFEAAARLAEVDEARAADALRSIVADKAFGSDIRSEAAARLAEVGG
jgi:hypothetical protein